MTVAAAYFEVADVMPPRYFTSPPPPNGVVVSVEHATDGVVSEWCVDPRTADTLERVAAITTGLRVVDRQPYALGRLV